MWFHFLNVVTHFFNAFREIDGVAVVLIQIKQHSFENMADRQKAEHLYFFVIQAFNSWNPRIGGQNI
ncbi:hypothetical protein SDC9_153015 [bioreactor metagenome]|uniref:Uncharacterized protein n=1 Tax=bioreactor metagenome TaxID=1076179 RepID=A0A645EX03_9ZZZZ